MASASSAMQTPAQYPATVASYGELVGDAQIFINALEKFHAAIGTKFMIPVVGGKVLDLHRLFVEVTSRGGIEKIIREKRWKEVVAVFNFPSIAKSASFMMRQYYGSLLQHFEQLYYFRTSGWTSTSTAPLPSILMAQSPALEPSPQYQEAGAQQPRTGLSGAWLASTASSPVIDGVIDGKFDCGYLVTVKIGSESLRGVLYHAPQDQVPLQCSDPANNSGSSVHAAGSGTQRPRRRRKKRDPSHPKRYRSGYNIFVSEHRARLKLLHPGKNNEIIGMIGELWNKLKESEKTVYQELALKDKERYRIEMEDYRKRLSTGRVTSNSAPVEKDTDTVEVDVKGVESEGGESAHTMDNESGSGGGSEDEVDDKTVENNLNMEESQVGVGLTDCGNNNNNNNI